jgi:tetratricopeptide (TPR) repeat protein
MTTTADARQLLQQGRLAEAERALESQLQRNPNDLDAITGLSMVALRHGQFAQSIALLQRALDLEPNNATTLHHLALAQDGAGASAAALESHRRAVHARPDFHVARLFYAEALERAGQMAPAVVHYLRALQDAQQAGRWLDPNSTPAALRSLVERAVITVRTHRASAFDSLFEPIAQQYGAASLQRVHKALRIYLRQEPPQ